MITDKNQAMRDLTLNSRIMDYVADLGYEFLTSLEGVRIIRANHIDISGFELPYGAADLDEYEAKLIEQERSMAKIREECRNITCDPGMTTW